jgi:hypothetical protein
MLHKILLSMVLGIASMSTEATGAESAKPAAPAAKPGDATRAADPLGNLKPYEERRYRIDMQDCDKQKGVDRKVCERTVRTRAVAKSRRRGNAH